MGEQSKERVKETFMENSDGARGTERLLPRHRAEEVEVYVCVFVSRCLAASPDFTDDH